MFFLTGGLQGRDGRKLNVFPEHADEFVIRNLNNIPLNSQHFFSVAARHLHLSKAAYEPCVTYSAVSHQIRSLENVLKESSTSPAPRHWLLSGLWSQFYAGKYVSWAKKRTSNDGLKSLII